MQDWDKDPLAIEAPRQDLQLAKIIFNCPDSSMPQIAMNNT